MHVWDCLLARLAAGDDVKLLGATCDTQGVVDVQHCNKEETIEAFCGQVRSLRSVPLNSALRHDFL